MESIQAWLNDKKNLPKILAALALVVVVAGAVVFMSRSGGEDTTAEIPPSAAPGAPGALAPAAPGMSPGATTGAIPDPNATAPVAQPAAPGGVGSKKEPPLEAYRSDPFSPFYGPKPKRAKPVFMAKLTRPDIRQVAPVIPGQGRVEAVKTLPPQPQRRMAGILKNNRVYAIIESEGTTTIVKPGDIINEHLMVDRITNDKIVLRSRNTTRPEFVEVPRSAGPPRPALQSTGQPGTTDTGPGRRGSGGGQRGGIPSPRGPGGPGLEGAPPPPGP